jgi:hypothetical protein
MDGSDRHEYRLFPGAECKGAHRGDMGGVSSEEFAVHLFCGGLSGIGGGVFPQSKKNLGIPSCNKGSRFPSRVIGGNPFNIVPAIDHTDDILSVAAIFLNVDHILIPAKRNPGAKN